MAAENISQEFRLKNKAKTQKKFITEINQNELMSKKHKKSCTVLNYIEHLLILASAVTGFNFCFCFVSWHFYRNYGFCSRIKNLCNNCRN